MSCKTWQDDDYEWPIVPSSAPAALDYAPSSPAQTPTAPPSTTAPPFAGQLFYVGPVANASETVIASTQAQGPSTNCTCYVNVLGDTHYNAGSIKFYAVIGGLRTQVGATGTLPASADSAAHVFNVLGQAADYFEVSLTPGSSGATKQIAVAIVGFGREAASTATGGQSGTITLAGDLGPTAASPTVVGVTGTGGTLAVHATTLQWDAGVANPAINQAGNGASGSAGASITITPQPANVAGNSTAGSLIVNLGAPSNTGSEVFTTLNRAGTTVMQLGPLVGTTANGAVYMGAITPTANNHSLEGDGTANTVVNVPTSGTVALAIQAVNQLALVAASITLTPATLQWGSGVTAPAIAQLGNGPSGGTAQSLTISPQAANVSGNSVAGGVNVKLGGPSNTGAEASFSVWTAGNQFLLAKAKDGQGYSQPYLYMGSPATATSASNYILFTDSNLSVLNCPSGGASTSLAVANTNILSVTNAQVQPLVSLVSWPSTVTSPKIQQAGSGASGGTAQSLTIAPQIANAAGNSTAGSLIVNLGAPSNTGSEVFTTLERAATTVMQLGPLVGTTANGAVYMGAITPTANNHSLEGDGTANTVLNVPTSGTVALAIQSTNQLAITASTIALTPATVQWGAAVVSPILTQATAASDVATTNLTIQSQAPFASAVTNLSPGNIILNNPAPVSGNNAGRVRVYGRGIPLITFGEYTASTVACMWMGNNLAISGSNFTLYNDTSTLYLNAITQLNLSIGGTGSSGLNITAASVAVWSAAIQWVSSVSAPAFSQAALASTSGASGSAGQVMSLKAQAGQAATGAAHNGGAGSDLTIAGGVGGTSGSATAGIGGSVFLSGGLKLSQVSKGATYTCDTGSTTADDIVLMTGNAFTITLPTPTAGRVLTFKDAAANASTQNKTIAPHAAETIDGAASYVLNLNNASVTLISDGTNWFVLSEYNGTVI